ncbi:isoaspartyl peptidase/L-asparaginase family protein [Bifidobacterium avesanii]|uniref:Isoaspartyl peptidase/L-asparaginase n=1 Tax=Bifidobacterium avesanii TaxID=1798157 RepID=A0A7K3TI51_9BIFI|nr:isoaspartyl peptidase/L-asparaginase [Bifidobacterium avesanii]KAB8292781.1 asparaginase [Bifidobacterium avesanii]NEG78389.1 isoaspartyl peptidase/L-asparaginase [Bifidobacterium avesanii]
MTHTQSSIAIRETVGSASGPLLLVHGGAGSYGPSSTPERRARVAADLRRALEAGWSLLEAGASAADAVCAAVRVMEDAEEFNAGRGAALTSEGKAQMDACLMTGEDGEVGSVAGVTAARHPIDAARAVKEQTKHVLFAHPDADQLRHWGVETEDPSYFVTEARRQSLERARLEGDEWEKHGTVGAVARDADGHVAAATSIGGITNQLPGRVGDSPLPGCGTYAADDAAAVSCTGIGEAFVKEVAAHEVADRMRFAGQSASDAAAAALDGVASHHGDGGMIVVPAKGSGVFAFNSEMMNRGWMDASGSGVEA